MNTSISTPTRWDWLPWSKHFYYGWVNLLIAALAMAATYPGRTHGLGMITEPMLRDLALDRVLYASLNFWGTLLGAAFCLPIGRWLDRYGCRAVLVLNMLLLGVAVMWMATVTHWIGLFVALILTRGLGQSALSVVSITLVAKWFTGRRLPMAMAWYSVVGVPMHLALIQGMKIALTTFHTDWRWAWAAVGGALVLGAAPLCWFFTRSTPPQDSVQPTETGDTDASVSMEGATLWQALATPAFWVFALTTSFWGMVYSGVALFNEAIFKERGLSTVVYFNALTVTAIVALVSKFAAGWLAGHWPITRLLAVCLVLMGGALLGLPWVTTTWHVYLYAITMGISTGVVALVFFAVWGQLYGRREVGRIQGIAQGLTVLASAFGPIVFASGEHFTQSFTPVFQMLAPVAFLMAVVGWFVPLPQFVSHTSPISSKALKPSTMKPQHVSMPTS